MLKDIGLETEKNLDVIKSKKKLPIINMEYLILILKLNMIQ